MTLKKNSIFYIFTFIFFHSILFAQTPEENKFQLAQSYEQSGELEEALRIYKEIYSTNKQEKYFEPIVRLYKQDNRFKELLPFVEDRIRNYSSAKNYILAGEIYWQLGQVNDANSMWDKARKDYGNTAETYISIALTLNQLKQFEKTVPILIEAKQKFSKNIDVIDALLKAYIFTNMYQDGFSEVLYLFSLTKDLQQAQSRLYTMMGSDTTATIFIDDAFSKEIKKDDNIAILSLYSWFLRVTKNYEKAFDIIVTLDNKQNLKGRLIFQFANESRLDEQFDIALKAYKHLQNIGKSTPYFASANYEYTQTNEARLIFLNNKNVNSSDLIKNFEPIINDYKQIIKDNPKTDISEQSKIRIATIERTIMANNNAAIEMLNDVIKTEFSDFYILQATNELVDIYILEGDLNKANELINNLLAKPIDTKSNNIRVKGNVKISANNYKQNQNNNSKQYLNEIKFNQAEILYYQGFIDSSLVLYTKLLDSLTDDIANDALSRITFIEQNKTQSEQLSAFAKAEYLVLRKKYSDAINNFDNIKKTLENESLGEFSIIKIAEIEINQNNNIAAKTILTNYLTENAYPLYGDNALFLLGNIAENENNAIDAQKYYGDILYKYPRSLYISDARSRIRTIRGN